LQRHHRHQDAYFFNGADLSVTGSPFSGGPIRKGKGRGQGATYEKWASEASRRDRRWTLGRSESNLRNSDGEDAASVSGVRFLGRTWLEGGRGRAEMGTLLEGGIFRSVEKEALIQTFK